MENSNSASSSAVAGPADAPREARPPRFATIDDTLLAETPLVSASQFASSLGNLANYTNSRYNIDKQPAVSVFEMLNQGFF